MVLQNNENDYESYFRNEFQKMDQNRDGLISYQDLMKLMKKCGYKCTEAELQDYVNEVEINEEEKPNEKLLIYTVTYNIHGNMPGNNEIQLLFPKRDNFDKFDIFVINTQECLRSITASYFVTSKEPWVNSLCNFFGDKYTNIINSNLGALHLSIFVKKEKVMNFHDLRTGEIKTGFLNIMANKGAVSASMKYFNKNILFISCHLDAGHNNQIERNKSLNRIGTLLRTTSNKESTNKLKSLKTTLTLRQNENNNDNNNNNNKLTKTNSLFFKSNEEEDKKSEEFNKQNDKETNKHKEKENNEEIKIENNDVNNDENNYEKENINKNNDFLDLNGDNESASLMEVNNNGQNDVEEKSTDDYDFVIMSGDFNYRLDIKKDEAYDYMEKNDPEILWEKDQFTPDIKEKNNYREGIIKFMPTYKYKDFSNEFDYSRIPGWTDRILYKSKEYYDIMLCEYSSIPEINISDHKPVYAVFKIDCKYEKYHKKHYLNREKECNII